MADTNKLPPFSMLWAPSKGKGLNEFDPFDPATLLQQSREAIKRGKGIYDPSVWGALGTAGLAAGIAGARGIGNIASLTTPEGQARLAATLALRAKAPSTAESKAAAAITNQAEQAANDVGLQLGIDTEIGTTGPSTDIGAEPAFPAYGGGQGVSQDQIAAMFAPLLGEIQGMNAPSGREVPEPFSPKQTFLSVLAGSLGSQLSRNPAVLEEVYNRINEREVRRQTIEDQNYATSMAFDQNKRMQVLGIHGKVLEAQLQNAIETGNQEAITKHSDALAKFQASVQIYLEKMQQTGATAREKMTIAGRTAGKEGGMSMVDFLKGLNDIQQADPKKLPETAATWFGGKRPLSKQDAVMLHYAGGAIGGNEAVAPLAMGRFITMLKAKYKLPDKISAGPNQEKQVRKVMAELISYGLPPQLIATAMGQFGVRVTFPSGGAGAQ